MTRIACPECEMLSINGVPCHETGCPNGTARYDDGEWIQQRQCFECGCLIDEGETCCDAEPDDERTLTITLPDYWASYIINGDGSGLTDDERAMCDRALERELGNDWRIVSVSDDDPRFTWSYRLYNPEADCSGGSVIDYFAIKT